MRRLRGQQELLRNQKSPGTQIELRKRELQKLHSQTMDSVMKLDKAAEAYARATFNGAKVKKNIWRFYFKENDSEDVRITRIQREWENAAELLQKGIEERAGWFQMPQLWMPAKRPILAITSPEVLALWFSLRLAANRQARFFVKCKECGAFAVRKRSTALYCSSRCQKFANVEATYRNREADLTEWLKRQPESRWLPPRMALRRMAANSGQ
jgi:hypothetical protein